MNKPRILFILLLSMTNIAMASNDFLLYNIQNFGPKDYIGSSQNWDICLDPYNIYVANNDGMLIYNGNNWDSYNQCDRGDNKTRAIKIIENRIYTAGDNNIGYWEKDTKRQWNYVSLMNELMELGIPNDNFWSIAQDKGNVYFQSFSRILKYDGNKFEEISTSCHMLMHECKTGIYTHRLFEGIQKIEDDKFKPVIPEEQIKNDETKFISELSDGSLIIGLSKGHVYKKDDNGISMLEDISKHIFPYTIDCGTVMNDEYIIIGTLGGGIFVFSINGKPIKRISSDEGLQSNIVHRVKTTGNDIWVTLDLGVSVIKLDPAITLWKKTKDIGKMSDAIKTDKELLVGTNQGLYEINQYGHNLVPDIRGEVFSLTNIKGKLICGSQNGCFLKRHDNTWEKISDIKGTYDFKYMAKDGKEFLIAASFTYITYFIYENGTWVEHSQVRDFLNTLEKIMPESLNVIWAVHPTKGLFRIKINNELNQTESVTNFKDIEGLTDFGHINMARIDGRILFFSPQGVFRYDIDNNIFTRNNKLSDKITGIGNSTQMTYTEDNEFWFTNGNEFLLYEITENNAELTGKISYDDYELTPIKEKTVIKKLGHGYYAASSIEGTTIINKNRLTNQKDNAPILTRIMYHDGGIQSATIIDNSADIPANASDIEICVAKPVSSKSSILRYRIKSDKNDSWSEWSKNGVISFKMLPMGKHAIEVEEYSGNKLLVTLKVNPPFFMSYKALVLYIITIAFAVFYVTRKFQHRKRRKIISMYEEEKRKKDEEITRITNEQLKETVHNQQNKINEKLRVISQKQELLINICDELDRQKKELGDRYPKKMYDKLRKIINEGMTTEKDFMLFQNYYQEVHHDFLLRMKEKHIDLTSGELMFCCLIRSNLSTKDMASILNITPRGVELKRYRLRKKLSLKEENLYDYILKL